MPVEDDTNPVLKQRSGVLDFAIGRLRPTSLDRMKVAQISSMPGKSANLGPLAPEARIMPLDQTANECFFRPTHDNLRTSLRVDCGTRRDVVDKRSHCEPRLFESLQDLAECANQRQHLILELVQGSYTQPGSNWR